MGLEKGLEEVKEGRQMLLSSDFMRLTMHSKYTLLSFPENQIYDLMKTLGKTWPSDLRTGTKCFLKQDK